MRLLLRKVNENVGFESVQSVRFASCEPQDSLHLTGLRFDGYCSVQSEQLAPAIVRQFNRLTTERSVAGRRLLRSQGSLLP
jgi:hypothetical protein